MSRYEFETLVGGMFLGFVAVFAVSVWVAYEIIF